MNFIGFKYEYQYIALVIILLITIDYANIGIFVKYRNWTRRPIFETVVVCLIFLFNSNLISSAITICICILLLFSNKFFGSILSIRTTFAPSFVLMICLLTSNLLIFHVYYFVTPRWMGWTALENVGAYTAPRYASEIFSCLVKVRNIHQDFVFINLLPNDAQDNVAYDMKSNYIARKSLYVGNVNHFYLFPQGYVENDKRLSAVGLISHSIVTNQRHSELFLNLNLPEKTPIMIMFPKKYEDVKFKGFKYVCGSSIFLSNFSIPDF